MATERIGASMIGRPVTVDVEQDRVTLRIDGRTYNLGFAAAQSIGRWLTAAGDKAETADKRMRAAYAAARKGVR